MVMGGRGGKKRLQEFQKCEKYKGVARKKMED
jgi:hypothetical protein